MTPKPMTCAIAAGLLTACWMGLVQAEPLADLLERAIYTEETKGDLAAAIEMYKEILGQAKSARGSAANAQFRLANCYLKSGQQSEAIAAFRQLIDTYPEETALVAKAKEHVPGSVSLLPAPWSDGELTELSMRLASGLDVGRQFTFVHAVEQDGRRMWRTENRSIVTLNGMRGTSSVDSDATTMAPITSRWRHTLLGDATAKFERDTVSYQFRNQDQPKQLPFDRPVYDNEECLFVMRRLPLAIGYQVTLTVFSSLGSGLIPIQFKVTGHEMIEVPAGKFNCFRLELSVGQTFFISDDEHRYLVRFEAGGVTADAVKFSSRQPGQRQTYRDDEAGISFQAPPDWLLAEHAAEGEKVVILLDPQGQVLARMQIIPPAKIEPGDTIDQWRQEDIGRAEKVAKDLSLRASAALPDSVGGQPAAGFIADFSDDRGRKVKYNLYAKGTKAGIKLTAVVDTGEFDAVRQSLDELVATIQFE